VRRPLVMVSLTWRYCFQSCNRQVPLNKFREFIFNN